MMRMVSDVAVPEFHIVVIRLRQTGHSRGGRWGSDRDRPYEPDVKRAGEDAKPRWTVQREKA